MSKKKPPRSLAEIFKRCAARKNKSEEVWQAEIALLDDFLSVYELLRIEHNELFDDYESLRKQHNDLVVAHERLQKSHHEWLWNIKPTLDKLVHSYFPKIEIPLKAIVDKEKTRRANISRAKTGVRKRSKYAAVFEMADEIRKRSPRRTPSEVLWDLERVFPPGTDLPSVRSLQRHLNKR